jgi:hypothetical protein
LALDRLGKNFFSVSHSYGLALDLIITNACEINSELQRDSNSSGTIEDYAETKPYVDV